MTGQRNSCTRKRFWAILAVFFIALTAGSASVRAETNVVKAAGRQTVAELRAENEALRAENQMLRRTPAG